MNKLFMKNENLKCNPTLLNIKHNLKNIYEKETQMRE